MFFFKFFRFEEECKTIEEEQCQTVYDDAWENVCEMVNVTLPATNCREITRIEMEKKYVLVILYTNLENFNLERIMCVLFTAASTFSSYTIGLFHGFLA